MRCDVCGNDYDKAFQVTREGGTVQVGLNPKARFDWQAWVARNSIEIRMPEVLACARVLRERHPHLAAVGFCWGGKAGVNLASREHKGLIDCLAIAHPGNLTEDEVRKIAVPIQIIEEVRTKGGEQMMAELVEQGKACAARRDIVGIKDPRLAGIDLGLVEAVSRALVASE